MNDVALEARRVETGNIERQLVLRATVTQAGDDMKDTFGHQFELLFWPRIARELFMADRLVHPYRTVQRRSDPAERNGTSFRIEAAAESGCLPAS